MKRANLIEEEVKHIIVSATMTMPEEDALADLLVEHVCRTPDKLGCHFYIPRDGEIITPVEPTKRGNWFARYGEDSIFIIVEGGLDKDANIANNFMAGQICWLKGIVKNLKKMYPNAELTLHNELFLGINPVITKEQIK